MPPAARAEAVRVVCSPHALFVRLSCRPYGTRRTKQQLPQDLRPGLDSGTDRALEVCAFGSLVGSSLRDSENKTTATPGLTSWAGFWYRPGIGSVRFWFACRDVPTGLGEQNNSYPRTYVLGWILVQTGHWKCALLVRLSGRPYGTRRTKQQLPQDLRPGLDSGT